MKLLVERWRIFGDFDESTLATLAINLEYRNFLVICVAAYMNCNEFCSLYLSHSREINLSCYISR